LFHIFGAYSAAHALAHEGSHTEIAEFYSLYLLWLAEPTNANLSSALARHSIRNFRPIPIQTALIREVLIQNNPLLVSGSEVETEPHESVSVPSDWLNVFISALSELPDVPDVKLWLMNTAKFVTAYAAFTQDQTALGALDPLLDRILVNKNEDAKVVSETAIALMNTTIGSSPGRRNVLPRLKSVGECRQWELDLRLTYARALVNLIKASDADEEWIDVCVNELLLIGNREDLEEETVEACMRGLHDAAVSLDLWERRTGIPNLVAKAMTIASIYCRYSSVVQWQAKILYNATAYFGRLGDIESVRNSFESLCQLVTEHATIELWPEVTAAGANLMVLALETADGELTDRAVTLADELPARVLETVEVRESYAIIHSAAAIVYKKIGDQQLMREALEKLEARAYEPLDAEFAKSYASALWRVMSNLDDRQASNYEYSFDLEVFNRLSRLIKRYIGYRSVVRECVIGIANFASLAGLQQDWMNLQQTMKQLQEGIQLFPEDAEIGSHVGRGHAVGWFSCSVAEQHDIASECESACKQLGGSAFEAMLDFQRRVHDIRKQAR
jgi:hypothetical protein